MDVNLNISSRILINSLVILIRRGNQGNNLINTTNAIASILLTMRIRRFLNIGRNINIPNGYTRVITNDHHSFYIHNSLLNI